MRPHTLTCQVKARLSEALTIFSWPTGFPDAVTQIAPRKWFVKAVVHWSDNTESPLAGAGLPTRNDVKRGWVVTNTLAYGVPFVKILYLTDLAKKLLPLRIFSYLCAHLAISAQR